MPYVSVADYNAFLALKTGVLKSLKHCDCRWKSKSNSTNNLRYGFLSLHRSSQHQRSTKLVLLASHVCHGNLRCMEYLLIPMNSINKLIWWFTVLNSDVCVNNGHFSSWEHNIDITMEIIE